MNQFLRIVDDAKSTGANSTGVKPQMRVVVDAAKPPVTGTQPAATENQQLAAGPSLVQR
ncbi:MAG: hypothetical protein P4N60_12080 [Verrucomicrobiae bacterium]|nr:hypothetical protein [Verrucomicrobiae bacterium]